MSRSIKEWPKSERPRERLLSQGAGALSDAELLAVKADGGWRFQEDRFKQWIAQQEPDKPKRSQHHSKPSQIHEYHMKKLIKTVKG